MAEYRYTVKNVAKYAGDARRVVARSKWELMYMQALDNSSNISYVNPLDKKVHQYWTDFLVQYTDNSIEILEIKPLKESLAENAKSTYDKLSLIKNMAKWAAADRFAKSIGARFRVITENQLFRRKVTKTPKRARTTRGTKSTQGTRK